MCTPKWQSILKYAIDALEKQGVIEKDSDKDNVDEFLTSVLGTLYTSIHYNKGFSRPPGGRNFHLEVKSKHIVKSKTGRDRFLWKSIETDAYPGMLKLRDETYFGAHITVSKKGEQKWTMNWALPVDHSDLFLPETWAKILEKVGPPMIFSGKESPFIGSTTKCNKCGSEGRTLKLCSGCKVARYCSKECQIAHWSEHKKMCQYATQRAKKRFEEETVDARENDRGDS